MIHIDLQPSTRDGKKYMVTIPLSTGRTKTVHFGADGYSDYTIHKDPERKERYDARHRAREDWDFSGIATAGFWSKWILWNKPSFSASVKDTERRFGLKIHH